MQRRIFIRPYHSPRNRLVHNTEIRKIRWTMASENYNKAGYTALKSGNKSPVTIENNAEKENHANFKTIFTSKQPFGKAGFLSQQLLLEDCPDLDAFLYLQAVQYFH